MTGKLNANTSPEHENSANAVGSRTRRLLMSQVAGKSATTNTKATMNYYYGRSGIGDNTSMASKPGGKTRVN